MARVRQQQKNIHHAIRDISLGPFQVATPAIAWLVRHPAPNLMVVRPVSVVVMYHLGQPGLIVPDRTRILAIVITDFMADLYGIIRTVNCRLGSV